MSAHSDAVATLDRQASQQLRARVLRGALVGMGGASLVASVTFVVQGGFDGTPPTLWLGIVAMQLLWLFAFAQRWLGYRRTAMLLLVYVGVLSTYFQIFRGVLPGTILAQVVLLVLAGLFLGRRAVIAAMVVLIASVSISATLALGGAVEPWPAQLWDPQQPLVWLRYLMVLTFLGGTISVMLVQMIEGLEETAARLRETLEREREVRAQNESVRSALERTARIEAMGQLAAGLAHDFNGTLNVIEASAKLLQSEPLGSPGIDALSDQIVEQTQLAAESVRRLLSLSRDDTGNPEPVVVAEVMRRSLPVLRQAVSEHVTLALDCATQAVARLDVGRFQQALVNLATNARDAMPSGGFWLLRVTEEDVERISLGWSARPGRFVCVACADRGAGVDPALTDRIFEPFFTTKASGIGTGLGLTMVRKTVLDVGGFIEVDTRPGTGTTFRLYVPIDAPDAHSVH